MGVFKTTYKDKEGSDAIWPGQRQKRRKRRSGGGGIRTLERLRVAGFQVRQVVKARGRRLQTACFWPFLDVQPSVSQVSTRLNPVLT